MTSATDLSGAEQIAAALERGAPVDELLDLADEAIERAIADGAATRLVRLAELLGDAASTRADARGLAVAATRARAAAASLGGGLPAPAPDSEGMLEREPLPPVELRYAGWWRRVGAFVVDWMILVSLMAAVPGESGLAVVFAVFVLPVGYFAGLHAYGHGRTIGKWVFGIAVRRAGGEPVDLARAVGRAIVQGVLWVTFVGGIVDSLVPLGDARRRTIHDRAYGTVVVRLR